MLALLIFVIAYQSICSDFLKFTSFNTDIFPSYSKDPASPVITIDDYINKIPISDNDYKLLEEYCKESFDLNNNSLYKVLEALVMSAPTVEDAEKIKDMINEIDKDKLEILESTFVSKATIVAFETLASVMSD